MGRARSLNDLPCAASFKKINWPGAGGETDARHALFLSRESEFINARSFDGVFHSCHVDFIAKSWGKKKLKVLRAVDAGTATFGSKFPVHKGQSK